MPISTETVLLVKSVLAAAGAGCAVILFVAHRYALACVRRATLLALVPVSALALFAYAHLGDPPAGTRYLNTYDVYHYYLGAKYFEELGYLYLYDATIVAAEEDQSRLRDIKQYRDQATYRIVDTRDALDGQQRWRGNFSDARWNLFKRDLAFFEPGMSLTGWRNALTDKGYNPSPVWTAVGAPLAHAVPARPGAAMWLLMHADFVFIAIALAALAWAFNAETALLSAVFFGINYTTPYSAIGASFLRLDWLMWLVLALCLMKRNLPGWSGAALAYAALLRLSPALYGVGLAAVAVRHYNLHGALPRWFWRFGIGGIVATALLVGFTCVAMPQPGTAWRAFSEKMALHKASLGTKRYGLIYLAVWNGDVTKEDVAAREEKYSDEQKFARIERFAAELLVSQAALAVLFVVAASRLRPWEAMALGSILVFVFLAPTRYYYAQLITLVPLLTHAWSKRRLVALLLLFTMMIVAAAVQLSSGLLAFIQFVVSLEMLFFFLYLMIALAWPSKPPRETVEPQPGEAAAPPNGTDAGPITVPGDQCD